MKEKKSPGAPSASSDAACGAIGYWRSRHGKLATQTIFEEYYSVCMETYVKAHECDDDAWERDLRREFVCREHIPAEKKLIKATIETVASPGMEKERTRMECISKNYLKFARKKIKTLYPPKYPQGRTLQEEFLSVYKSGGAASDCVDWIRTEFDLPCIGLHFSPCEHIPEKEKLSEELKEYYEVTLPEHVLEEYDDFDNGVLISRDGGLMEEIDENLKQCATIEDRERYLCCLVQCFQEFADVFFPQRRIEERKRSIEVFEKAIVRREKEVDLKDEKAESSVSAKEQIEAYNKFINDFQEDIKYWEKVANRLYDIVQESFSEENEEKDKYGICKCLAGWWDTMITFARRLAALALSYGIDLKDIQDTCKVYIISHLFITDYVDAHYVSNYEYAELLMDRIRKEDKEPPRVEGLPDKLKINNAENYFEMAEAKGWMTKTRGKYEWKGLGIGKNGTLAQFAYFCGRIYGYKHAPNGNIGSQIPAKDLEEYFGMNNIYKSIVQAHSASKPQAWRRCIDEIFPED
jgi:hypothetical protein